MADFTRIKYGQVEPNQLSAQKTGQIYASLPLDTNVKTLQNGEFMYYDYKSGKVSATDSTGVAEPMLVFNEIKLYDEFWRHSYKDFAMIRVDTYDNSTNPPTLVPGENYVTTDLVTAGYGDGATNPAGTVSPAHTEYPYRMAGMAPRLFKTNVGDIYTTNMVKIGTGIEYEVGDLLQPKLNSTSHTLVLEEFVPAQAGDKPVGMTWVVVKVYTMPDGQPGLKLQRVQ